MSQQIEEEEVPTPLVNLGSLNISEIIKSSQSQNGLKHSDYSRYRKYCVSRVKRIRKTLKFSYGKKFTSKDVVAECPNDHKTLMVLLFQAEKNWAYAMHLKSQANAEVKKSKSTRCKFHLRNKLKRALQWSRRLQVLCEERTEKRTALEAEAYATHLEGMWHFEKEQWVNAQESYLRCRSIYSDITKVSDSMQQVLYNDKIEQIDQALRYCNHKASKGKNMMTIESILEMKQQIKDPALSQKLDELLEQHRNDQIESKQGLLQVEYHGEQLPVKNPKVITDLQKIKESNFNISQITERIQSIEVQDIIELYDQSLDNYIQLFSLYDDAIKLINKDKEDTANSEAEKNIFIKVLGYLTLQRQMAVLDRNDALIKQAIAKFIKEEGTENLQNLSTKKALKNKLTTPQEIIKHCDNYQQGKIIVNNSIYQVLKQIMDVERMNPDLSLFKRLNIQETFCRALRCFFVACLYFSNSKYQETVSLLKFNEILIENARDKAKENAELLLAFIPALSSQLLLKCKLNALRDQHTQQTQIGEQIQQLSVQDKTTEQINTKKSLFSLCQDQDIAATINLDNVLSFRTADLTEMMQMILPRPIQFDLAYEQIGFPDLEEKKEQEQKKGFWGKFNIFKK